MKKKLIVFMSLMMLCGVGFSHNIRVEGAAPLFSDIEGHWAKTSIERAVEKGYVDGYEDGTFVPDNSVTRVEFMKMVVDALKLPKQPQKEDNSWFQPHVDALLELGIHNKKDFNEDFGNPITREDMARLAVRATDKSMQDPKVFLDVNAGMYHATRTGLIQGLYKGELGRQETTTRSQAVTVIERILSLREGKTLEVDKAAASYAEIDMSETNGLTMWNQKFLPLPLELEGAYGIPTMLEKIVIVDMDDPTSAYYDWFKDFQTRSGGSLKNHYLIAIKSSVDITPENATQERISYSPSFRIELFKASEPTTDEGLEFWLSKRYKTLWTDEIGHYEGWVAHSVEKDWLEEYYKNNKYKNIRITNTYLGKTQEVIDKTKK